MPVFGRWSRRKAPTQRNPDPKVWKSGAEFLGAILLLQCIPTDRPIISDEQLGNLTRKIDPGLRKHVERWISLYVIWLLRLLSREAYSEDFSRDIMASVYGRMAVNEDRLPNIDVIADGIKFWFKELDHVAQVAATSTTTVEGQRLPLCYFVALRFLSSDSGSPYADNPNPKFDGRDFDVASVLAEAQDIAIPKINLWIEKAGNLPR